MKKIHKYLLVIFLFCTLSCSKEDQIKTKNEGLTGKWKLTEYLSDPGNGSGKWQKVTEEFADVIEFHADGRFSEVKGNSASSIPLFDSYKVLDNKRIEMIPTDKSQSTHIWYYSDLSANSLTLGYGCIEACSGKYIAIE